MSKRLWEKKKNFMAHEADRRIKLCDYWNEKNFLKANKSTENEPSEVVAFVVTTWVGGGHKKKISNYQAWPTSNGLSECKNVKMSRKSSKSSPAWLLLLALQLLQVFGECRKNFIEKFLRNRKTPAVQRRVLNQQGAKKEREIIEHGNGMLSKQASRKSI